MATLTVTEPGVYDGAGETLTAISVADCGEATIKNYKVVSTQTIGGCVDITGGCDVTFQNCKITGGAKCVYIHDTSGYCKFKNCKIYPSYTGATLWLSGITLEMIDTIIMEDCIVTNGSDIENNGQNLFYLLAARLTVCLSASFVRCRFYAVGADGGHGITCILLQGKNGLHITEGWGGTEYDPLEVRDVYVKDCYLASFYHYVTTKPGLAILVLGTYTGPLDSWTQHQSTGIWANSFTFINNLTYGSVSLTVAELIDFHSNTIISGQTYAIGMYYWMTLRANNNLIWGHYEGGFEYSTGFILTSFTDWYEAANIYGTSGYNIAERTYDLDCNLFVLCSRNYSYYDAELSPIPPGTIWISQSVTAYYSTKPNFTAYPWSHIYPDGYFLIQQATGGGPWNGIYTLDGIDHAGWFDNFPAIDSGKNDPGYPPWGPLGATRKDGVADDVSVANTIDIGFHYPPWEMDSWFGVITNFQGQVATRFGV